MTAKACKIECRRESWPYWRASVMSSSRFAGRRRGGRLAEGADFRGAARSGKAVGREGANGEGVADRRSHREHSGRNCQGNFKFLGKPARGPAAAQGGRPTTAAAFSRKNVVNH